MTLTPSEPRPNDSEKTLLYKIALNGGAGGGGGGGGGAPAPVVNTFMKLGPLGSVNIPVGSVEWTVSILSGTASIGDASGLPTGFSDSGIGPLDSSIPILADGDGSVYVRWAAPE